MFPNCLWRKVAFTNNINLFLMKLFNLYLFKIRATSDMKPTFRVVTEFLKAISLCKKSFLTLESIGVEHNLRKKYNLHWSCVICVYSEYIATYKNNQSLQSSFYRNQIL